MTRLVIVESPAKAKKIGQFLGDGYVVEASVGHIRDLPQRAADIPAAYKGIAWAKEGVNVDNGFEPLYVVDGDKKKKLVSSRRCSKMRPNFSWQQMRTAKAKLLRGTYLKYCNQKFQYVEWSSMKLLRKQF